MSQSIVLHSDILAAVVAGGLVAVATPAAAATEWVVHAFQRPEGINPVSALIKVGSKFYGTADYGGTGQQGTVFSMTTAGHLTVLHSFLGGSDGAMPQAELLNVNGTLYGTTSFGGANTACDPGCGTVFKITPQGQYSVIHSFQSGTDGSEPIAGLINIGGMLYGTTYRGGRPGYGFGTVFQITPQGVEKVIYAFRGKGDGGYPSARLTSVGNTMYGTASYFGSGPGCGTVFKINSRGDFKVVYAFGIGACQPMAPLLNVGGILYGTTDSDNGTGFQGGTVFSVTPQGAEKVLWKFGHTKNDGVGPVAGLTYLNNKLYGTTYSGGSGGSQAGFGTVFSITRQGQERVVYSFSGGGDGQSSQAALLDVNGVLFGTTVGGGPGNGGVVFKIAP